MPMRDTIKGLRSQFDQLLDKIDPQSAPTPPAPPVPYTSRPGGTPAVPHASRPPAPPAAGHAPPPPARPVPAAADAAPPPPYSAVTAASEYWRAQFAPGIPVSAFFEHETGASGWGNNEAQNYTSAAGNAFHTAGGALVLRAAIASQLGRNEERYTSARLLSRQRLARARGYVSAVLAAPCAPGVWPAFWLLPQEPCTWPTDGEVDIFEAWDGKAETHSCLHWGDYTSAEGRGKHRTVSTAIHDVQRMHEYGFAWEQPEEWGQEGGRLVWYIDGRAVMKAPKPPGTRRLEEWRILLNIAVGGTVCNGRIPVDGVYDMVVSKLAMSDTPPGGWNQFENDWRFANGGKALD